VEDDFPSALPLLVDACPKGDLSYLLNEGFPIADQLDGSDVNENGCGFSGLPRISLKCCCFIY
jgi:hypothetical protein